MNGYQTVSGSNAIFTFTTAPTQLQVHQGNGSALIHTIFASYSPGRGFAGSTGKLSPGLRVNPAALTITATANTKIYDGSGSAAALPTVSGLQGNDNVTGLAEVYNDATVGSGKTLSVYTAGTLSGAVTFPLALAFDGSGNLYIANGNNTVTKFAPGASTPSATLTGLGGPHAMAFDSSGNLYVANAGNTVSKFAPGATTPTATLTGLIGPWDLAFDGNGNLYVSNFGGPDTVSKFAPGATTPSATLTGLSGPRDLAFDGNGNLYVANYNNGTVSKFLPGATTPSATLRSCS